jgi:hypothetical protein
MFTRMYMDDSTNIEVVAPTSLPLLVWLVDGDGNFYDSAPTNAHSVPVEALYVLVQRYVSKYSIVSTSIPLPCAYVQSSYLSS